MQASYNEQNINALLQKLRIFNKAIGSYELFAINETFQYVVKLSNGRILLSLEDLQNDEKDSLTPERLAQIANSFKPTTAKAEPTYIEPHEPTVVKRSNRNMYLIAGIFLALVIISVIIYMSQNNTSFDDYSISPAATYQDKVMSVEDIERSDPSNFLTAQASYNQNFLGNKIKVNGSIINKATVASYKDAVIRITYYSKTNTALTTSEHTIYEALPPTSTVSFDLKVDNYKDVTSIGVEVISAMAL